MPRSLRYPDLFSTPIRVTNSIDQIPQRQKPSRLANFDLVADKNPDADASQHCQQMPNDRNPGKAGISGRFKGSAKSSDLANLDLKPPERGVHN